MKQHPEFASAIGDRRYNSLLEDLSPRAFNDEASRQREFQVRLLSLDPASLSAPQKATAQLLARELQDAEDSARFKQWQMPIGPCHNVPSELLAEVSSYPFETVKDYDDYVSRLQKIPAFIRQLSEDLLAGIDNHRVPAGALVQSALQQTDDIAGTTPQASPFAEPLKRFPAQIDAPTRRRIAHDLLEAIQNDLLPAYARFARFLRVVEVPASQVEANLLNAQDAAAYSNFCENRFSTLQEKKMLELKARAQQALGPRFDLKAFHDLLEAAAAVPLDVLEQRGTAWIAAQR